MTGFALNVWCCGKLGLKWQIINKHRKYYFIKPLVLGIESIDAFECSSAVQLLIMQSAAKSSQLEFTMNDTAK